MCLNPTRIPGSGFAACRLCWQCRERKVDDWVGRNIAESQTAKAAHAVSLTYGRDKSTGGVDHLRAAVLTYSDVQKMLKHLRADGFPVRYFAVGEYGSAKGRAHWHILLYWQDEVPADIQLRTDFFSWKYWPHGYSYWDSMGQKAVRYCCKYLLKDPEAENAQAFGPMPSKKPPLGDQFFRGLAEQYVEQGLSPQNLFYSFPDVRRVARPARGKTEKTLRDQAAPIQFLMRGKTAENFRSYFETRWNEVHPNRPYPRSDVFDNMDKNPTPPFSYALPDANDVGEWGRDADGWRWSRRRRGFKHYYEYYKDDKGRLARHVHGKEKPSRPPTCLPTDWQGETDIRVETRALNWARKSSGMAGSRPVSYSTEKRAIDKAARSQPNTSAAEAARTVPGNGTNGGAKPPTTTQGEK